MDKKMIDSDKLITQSEYARLKGVSPAAVSKMIDNQRVKSLVIKGSVLVVLP